jgi:hypothetical protein
MLGYISSPATNVKSARQRKSVSHPISPPSTPSLQSLRRHDVHAPCCRWGAVEEIVTDNGMANVVALDWLAERFGIRHIRISAYNSRANGIVERQHRTIRESIVKGQGVRRQHLEMAGHHTLCILGQPGYNTQVDRSVAVLHGPWR